MDSRMLDLNAVIRAHLGAALAQCRAARGWAVEDLAAASGLDRQHLRAVEAGSVLLAEADQARVAAALGVEPDSLYDGFLDTLRGSLWPAQRDGRPA
ncbi:helix-turn-helix domain-containing protein [Roseospira goensis]|uniref:Transcriptional regulator with XRE-family HTH domain n=1 Tax=Roseospira goensis TaxID=391922 RepID=A0A7W6WLH9_9PROT|nr:helix-turn-helix transcriptional regulator [Roseospira goensis]MBB4287431.1 transcriptional regulator with XRE-family HTH domain [Roseospira goensis]